MSPTRSKEMVMGHHHWSVSLTNKTFREIISWYERLGLNNGVFLAVETAMEIVSINVEDMDADQLSQRLLKNFYNLDLSVLVARFMVAQATSNMSKSDDQMFRNMIDVKDRIFQVILNWLRNHNVEYDRETGSLREDLRDLGGELLS